MNERSRSPNAKTGWLFAIGFLLGSVAWFRVFAVAFFAPAGEAMREVIQWWFVGAGLVSAVMAAFQPHLRLAWSVSFAVPIVAWCLLCTFCAFSNTRLLWWTWIGGITAATAFLGALAGRITGRKL